MIDRTEVNRALAKAIAYKQCGKDHLANQWACELVKLLECAAILKDDATSPAEAVYAAPVRPYPVGTRRTVNGMPVEMCEDGRWHGLGPVIL